MLFNNKNNKGFTLIELLVVIAIIGILSSVVIASLNTAREKGKIANIKGNLKNMATAMENSYSDVGNYSAISTGGNLPYRPNTVCLSPVANMVTSIAGTGAKTRCLSTNVSGWSDNANRWGATSLIPNSNPIKAYSVSNNGVVTWDTQGVNTSGAFVSTDVQMTWNQAVTACSLSGGRLPTIEELKTLADAQCEASGSVDCTVDSARNPAGFVAGNYWSGTTVPSGSGYAYSVYLFDGLMYSTAKSLNKYVRCVR